MKKNYEKEIKKLYASYNFIEEDISKFKEIVLESIPDNMKSEEMIVEAKKNITKYIVSMINSESFLELFKRTSNKLGIEATFSLYDMILKETDTEISVEDIMALTTDNDYTDYYEKVSSNNDINNELLNKIVEIHKSLKEDIDEEIEDETNNESLVSILTDDHVHDYILLISKFTVLSREEEQELLKQYEETQDEYYKNEFIEHNLKLSLHIAAKYKRMYPNLKLGLMDLVQEANIGLLKAFDKFDRKSGYKFSTYANWWIRQRITRAIQEQNDTIKIPVHISELISKKNRFIDSYIKEKMRKPKDEEIMEYLNLAPKEYKLLTDAEEIKTPKSIDISIEQDDSMKSRESTFSTFIKDEETSRLEDSAIEKCYGSQLLRFVDEVLTEREAQVMRERCGFNEYNDDLTLQEIGDKLGLTRERIRQIENKAIDKLQRKIHLIEPELTPTIDTILSKKDLEEKLKTKNMSNIQIIEYRKIKGRSVFKCLDCNSSFTESPLDLLKRGTCPNCVENNKVLTKNK